MLCGRGKRAVVGRKIVLQYSWGLITVSGCSSSHCAMPGRGCSNLDGNQPAVICPLRSAARVEKVTTARAVLGVGGVLGDCPCCLDFNSLAKSPRSGMGYPAAAHSAVGQVPRPHECELISTTVPAPVWAEHEFSVHSGMGPPRGGTRTLLSGLCG
jgi:hypothetical protein